MERVGIYNRCSTEEESQINALATQVAESREIAEKKGWRITEQYVESRTGTVAYKRREYQRLLGDMEKDRFDIVMIKSIDRLMRSAKDWYFFLSRLTENHLKLYIYIEGKFHTTDDNLISGIKAILAEDFSRELSKKIKNAHRRRQEKKSGCNITCPMFGWNKLGRDLYEINEKEAEYYRTAFALAREGKGFYTISNRLYELGARGRKGQKISEVQWRKMLYSPRAHGTVVLNTRTYNFDTKRYEQVPQEEWVVMEKALPEIVSREYQEKVIRLMQERAAGGRIGKRPGVGKGRGKYALTGKIKCAECGRHYYRTSHPSGQGKRVVWKCASFLEGGRKAGEKAGPGCDNIHLSEDKLLLSLKEVFQRRGEFPEEEEERLLRKFMLLLKETLWEKSGKEEEKRLEKEYEKLQERKDRLMGKLLEGVIGNEDFSRYGGELTEKMKELREHINRIKEKEKSYNNSELRFETIREAIRREGLLEQAAVMALTAKTDHMEIHRDGRILLFPEGAGKEWEEAYYDRDN